MVPTDVRIAGPGCARAGLQDGAARAAANGVLFARTFLGELA